MTFSFLKTTVLSVLLVVAPIAAIAEQVLVVNMAELQATSSAGKDATKKLQAIQETMARELDPQAKALAQEEQSLRQQVQAKTSQAELAADTGLQARTESFARRKEQFLTKQRQKAADFQYTTLLTQQKINEALKPILERHMRNRGATILLDKRQVYLDMGTVDITAEALQELNARLPSVSVVLTTTPAAPSGG